MMHMAAALRVELRALHRLLRGRNGRADGEHLPDGGLARVHLHPTVLFEMCCQSLEVRCE